MSELEQLRAENARLKAENEELTCFKIRFQVWKQFYGQLLSVPESVDEDTRVKRQATIITHMQRRIRHQREVINLMNDRFKDTLAAPKNFPTYNVYRHNNKLYNLWREAEAKIKELLK